MTSETDVFSVTGGMWTTTQQTSYRPGGPKYCTRAATNDQKLSILYDGITTSLFFY